MYRWMTAFSILGFLVLIAAVGLAQEIGIIDTAGFTYCDYQHGGTCGRMIDVDDHDMVSLVWMNCLIPSPDGPRYVYYNVWDPVRRDFAYFTSGARIDASQRAGYVCQTTSPDGFCFAAFHGLTVGDNFLALVATPYAPYSDAFTEIEITPCHVNGTEVPIGYPKIDADIHGNLHLISTELPGDDPDTPLRIYYSRGIPEYDEDGYFLDIHWEEMSCGGFELWDTVTVISADVACSRRSLRIAAAWCHPTDGLYASNNDIYLRVSEDGGINWDPPQNVTHWTSQDTLRAFTDCSVLFDESDYLHIAFTTTRVFSWGDSAYGISMIWHWSEETDDLSLVANGWWPDYELNPGAWQLFVQRPSLAIDPVTGYLYCSYQQLDPETLSWAGFPLADAFVTVSSNNGRSWAVGTNVTNTMPDSIPAPPGESLYERDITAAPLVTDGFLHMEYVLDKDAGTSAYGEGVATLNSVIYQRIPVDQIDLRVPSAPPDLPDCFVLHANYPNPFNPTTTLQFDLVRSERVTLRIFNVLGQEVATLLDRMPLSPGVHAVEFDGSGLPSGVYLYRLESEDFIQTRKMVLMK